MVSIQIWTTTMKRLNLDPRSKFTSCVILDHVMIFDLQVYLIYIFRIELIIQSGNISVPGFVLGLDS